MPENIVEDIKAVISNEYDGSIIPIKQLQISRDILLKPGARVSGSIYGRDIEIRNRVNVNGPIVSNRKITFDLDNTEDGEIYLKSDVYSTDSILVNKPQNLKKQSKPLKIKGDVVSKMINLKNCLVNGSVIGNNVILDECIVLGFVISKKGKISITNSTVFSIFGEEDIELEKTKLFIPFIHSKNGKIMIKDDVGIVTAPEEIYNECTLRESDISTYRTMAFAETFWRTPNLDEIGEEYNRQLKQYIKIAFSDEILDLEKG